MSDATAEARLELERDQRRAQLKRAGQWRLIIGGLLTITIIGSVVGLPLIVSGIMKLRKARSIGD